VSRATRAAVTLLARVAPGMRRAVVDLSTISRDEAVVADYRADPLVHHGHPTIALSLAMLHQMTLLAARARDLRLPLLVQHGTADRICDPAGSRALETAVGTDDLTVRWYDGLWHEIYHEPERAQPLADLREWLAARR
jgi:acylglycerol lipase